MKNLPRLLASLGIDAHQVVGYGPFFRQPTRKHKDQEGLQVDLLIARKGQVLTLVECKFTARPIGVSVIDEVKRKVRLLGAPSRYTVERVLVSAGGVTRGVANSDYFHRILGLEALL